MGTNDEEVVRAAGFGAAINASVNTGGIEPVRVLAGVGA